MFRPIQGERSTFKPKLNTGTHTTSPQLEELSPTLHCLRIKHHGGLHHPHLTIVTVFRLFKLGGRYHAAAESRPEGWWWLKSSENFIAPVAARSFLTPSYFSLSLVALTLTDGAPRAAMLYLLSRG